MKKKIENSNKEISAENQIAKNVENEILSANQNSTSERETNKVELCGYVGLAPKVYEFKNKKKKVVFKIATHHNIKLTEKDEVQKITNWFPISAWNETADEVLSWIRIGQKVKIKGYLSYRVCQDNEGKKRSIFEAVATEIKAVGAQIA